MIHLPFLANVSIGSCQLQLTCLLVPGACAGCLRLLEAVRTVGLTEQVRFYQASSSELYGKVREVPQSETTPFYPRSPYAVAKLFAYHIVLNYREAYGLFAANGILFNHESPRRGARLSLSPSPASLHTL